MNRQLLILFISIFAFFNQALAVPDLNNQIARYAVVEILHRGGPIELQLGLPHKMVQYKSAQKVLVKDYFVLELDHQDQTLTLPALGSKTTRLSILSHVTHESATELFNIQKKFAAMQTINMESQQQMAEEIYALAYSANLAPAFRQSVLMNLAYWYLKKNEFEKVLSLSVADLSEVNLALSLQCILISKSINNPLLDYTVKSQTLSAFAKNITEKLRHQRGNADVGEPTFLAFTEQLYNQQCASKFATFVKQSTPENKKKASPACKLASIGIEEKSALLLIAESAFELSKDYCLLANDNLTSARFNSRYWHYFNYLNRNEMATIVAKKAIGQITLLTEPRYDELAQIYQQLNAVLKRLGKFEEAQSYQAKALAISDKVEFTTRAVMLFSAGYLYRELGNFEVAKRYFDKVLLLYQQKPNDDKACYSPYEKHSRVAKVLTQLGYIERNLDEHSKAENYIECALSIFKSLPEYYELVAIVEKAKLLTRKNPHQAIQLVQSTLSLNEWGEESCLRLNSLPITIQERQLADLLLVMLASKIKLGGEKEDIERFACGIAKILTIKDLYAEEGNALVNTALPSVQLELYRLMIEYSGKNNELENMEIFFRKAKRLFEHVRGQSTSPSALNSARFSLVETYVDLILLNESPKKKGQKIFNALEALYYLDLEQEQQFYSSSSHLSDHASWDKFVQTSERLFAAEEKELESLKSEVDVAFDSFVREPSFQPSWLAQSPLDLSSVQNKMEQAELLVRFFIGENNSFALIVSKHSLKIKKLPSERAILTISELERKGLANLSWQGLKTNHELQQLLPLSYLQSGKYTKLIIIPDSIIHRLPLSAVNVSNNRNQYIPLNSKIETIRTHSFSSYFADIANDKNENQSVAIFAAHTPELAKNYQSVGSKIQRNWLKQLPPIYGVLEEAKHIQNVFAKEKLLLATGKGAKRSFLLSSEVRASKIFHISTHGLYNPAHPEVVGLMTASEKDKLGFISFNELMSMPVYSELVVISGCNTMLGKYYKGTGMRSLSRGFLAQGAGSVLGTLWPVSDKATATFISDFYTELKANGGQVSKALQQTKNKFSRVGKYKKPKYWAGFVLNSSNKSFQKIQFAI